MNFGWNDEQVGYRRARAMVKMDTNPAEATNDIHSSMVLHLLGGYRFGTALF